MVLYITNRVKINRLEPISYAGRVSSNISRYTMIQAKHIIKCDLESWSGRTGRMRYGEQALTELIEQIQVHPDQFYGVEAILENGKNP